MKNLFTTFFATLFTSTLIVGIVSAAGSNIHGGFATDNPDLYPSVDDRGNRDSRYNSDKRMVTASQPGVGDNYSHYQGSWAIDNGDFFMYTREHTGTYGTTNIYQGFSDNPDL